MAASVERRPTDKEIELSVANMLRAGVIASAVMVLAGGLWLLRHPFAPIPDYTHFNPGDPSLRTLGGVLGGALHRHARHLIQLGILVLIATPLVRVIFCLIGFARQKDKLYVSVSLTVLLVLIYSLARVAH